MQRPAALRETLQENNRVLPKETVQLHAHAQVNLHNLTIR